MTTIAALEPTLKRATSSGTQAETAGTIDKRPIIAASLVLRKGAVYRRFAVRHEDGTAGAARPRSGPVVRAYLWRRSGLPGLGVGPLYIPLMLLSCMVLEVWVRADASYGSERASHNDVHPERSLHDPASCLKHR